MTRHRPAFAVAVLCTLVAAGCNRSQGAGANASGLPATQPVAAAPAAPTDPCPSIGTLAESRGGRIGLGAARVVRLTSICSAAQMTEHLRSFGAGSRFILVADDLSAGSQPNGPFELQIGPPTTSEAAVIGALNAYPASGPGGGGQPHSVSYDVTRQMQSLAIAGWPTQGLGVAITPSGAAPLGADSSIGAVRLVAEAPR